MKSPLDVPVSTVVAQFHDIIEVDSNVSIKAAVLALSRNKISSLAVVGEPGHWVGAGGQMVEAHGKQYIGLVSAFDLVAHLVKPLTQEQPSAHYSVSEAMNHPIVQLVGESSESLSLWWMPATESYRQLLEEFSRGVVHRALVVSAATDDNEKSVKLVTQTDALRFALGLELPLLSQTMGSISHKTKKCAVTVSAGMPLVEAVLLMTSNSILAVPVLNVHHNTVLTTLSVSDFKHLIDEEDGSLITDNLDSHSVGSFLEDVNGCLAPPLTYNSHNTLGQTIRMMVDNHVHRLWKFESDGTTMVFSMSDAISLLLK